MYRDEKSWQVKTFFEVITAAVNDFADHGFDKEDRLLVWAQRLRQSAIKSMVPEVKMEQQLKTSLTSQFDNLVNKGGLKKTHKKVPGFTIERIKPKLRSELDRRILASTSLIKLNRERSVDHTLQRFAGWATSIPPGGVSAEGKLRVKKDIQKSLKQLPYEERRVIIDQTHKLNSAINNIVAVDAGAIAAVWHSHWKETGYDYRPDHKVRDLKCFALSESWAVKRGLVKKGAGYYEDIDSVGQKPFCRCYAEYVYTIDELPGEMLTEKGRVFLEEMKKATGI